MLSEHRENRSMTADITSERDPLSQAEENLLSEENESANSSQWGTDKVLADVLSTMTQMSSTMLSMENAMKRLAGAPEDHATPPKKRRKPPATSAMSDSGDSDPEKSDFEQLNFPPNGDPPKLGSSVTEDALLNEIAQDFESDEQTDLKVAQKLVDIVNKRWGSKLEEAKLKKKLAKYNRPNNCEKLTVPKVNPEIWNKLKHVTRSADLRLADMQKVLVKVGSAVAKLTDTLLALRANPEKTSVSALGELVMHNADALALLGHVNIGCLTVDGTLLNQT